MRALRFGIVVAVLGLVACATPLPPGIKVTDVGMLAGTYHGSAEETGVVARPARIVLNPDGSFEVTVTDPGGFRYNGRVVAAPDGSLLWTYDNDRSKGRGTVYEGDGRRAIVFERADGRATIRVDKSLP